MGKRIWKPSTLVYPVPAVMVTCADGSNKPNIITLAWAGTVNSDPPMLSISVRKERYSHDLIQDRGEFVVNLTTEKLAYATDFCGVKSGRDIDKFKAVRLTPGHASRVGVPIIEESPVNIECQVRQIIELGSHDMFIAQVVAVDVDEQLLDDKGKLRLDKAGLIAYSHGEYWSLKKPLGYFGFSVTKKKHRHTKPIK